MSELPDSWDRSYSWSKMSTYQTCPRQFRFKYIDELEEEGESEIRDDGINFHEYMEQYYTRLENPEEGPTEDHAVSVAQEMFNQAFQAKYRDWIIDWHEWNLEAFKAWGKEHWTPHEVEAWVEVETDGSLDAMKPGETHHGYIDRIQWSPKREAFGIVDYKRTTKTNSSIKGQTAYYGEILLKLSDMLDAPVTWAGCYGYTEGTFKTWDIHWASTKATKRKINALRTFEDGFEPEFGMHCDWCPYVEECTEEEAENEGLLGI